MYKYSELTQQIIKAAQNVHNELGYGFLEKVYQNSLVLELHKMGLDTVTEKPISVHYDGQIVGDYFADIIVDGKVILEIKAVQAINPAHEAQLVNYLKAGNIDVGLLLNFGKSLEVKRKIFETARMI
ncbi:MAG: GxxExxY protein [Planctomycetota bacterium]|jgi:GxxExxY protein